MLWGPGRHGIGHNLFTYHRWPNGLITELFAELDQMKDEALGYFEPRALASRQSAASEDLAEDAGRRQSLGPDAAGRNDGIIRLRTNRTQKPAHEDDSIKQGGHDVQEAQGR